MTIVVDDQKGRGPAGGGVSNGLLGDLQGRNAAAGRLGAGLAPLVRKQAGALQGAQSSCPMETLGGVRAT